MSASRSSSMRALGRLASSSSSSSSSSTAGRAAAAAQVRRLHMLDPAVFPATTTPKKPMNSAAASGQSSLEAAPQQQTATSPSSTSPAAGGASASATVTSSSSSSSSSSSPPRTPVDVSFQSRHFTTSRHTSATRDLSSIDFAYLPYLPAAHDDLSSPAGLRVPLVPWNFETTVSGSGSASSKQALQTKVDAATSNVHRPIISTVSGEGTHIETPSAMSETVDATSSSVSFDLHDFGAALRSVARNSLGSSTQHVGEQVQKAQGVVKQVWSDMLDDVFGNKSGSSSSGSSSSSSKPTPAAA